MNLFWTWWGIPSAFAVVAAWFCAILALRTNPPKHQCNGNNPKRDGRYGVIGVQLDSPPAASWGLAGNETTTYLAMSIGLSCKYYN